MEGREQGSHGDPGHLAFSSQKRKAILPTVSLTNIAHEIRTVPEWKGSIQHVECQCKQKSWELSLDLFYCFFFNCVGETVCGCIHGNTSVHRGHQRMSHPVKWENR